MAPRKRKSQSRFLSSDETAATTKWVVERWRSGSGKIAMVGGAAMQFYGSDRLTKDVDFVADDTDPADRPASRLRFLSDLSFGGKRYLAPGDIPVDVIVRKDEAAPLYEASLDAADPTDEGFFIVTPEHLAAMKFDAMRAKDEIDLLWLLAQKDLVDVRKAEEIVREFLGGSRVAKEFRQLVHEAEWRAKEGEFRDKLDVGEGSEE